MRRLISDLPLDVLILVVEQVLLLAHWRDGMTAAEVDERGGTDEPLLTWIGATDRRAEVRERRVLNGAKWYFSQKQRIALTCRAMRDAVDASPLCRTSSLRLRFLFNECCGLGSVIFQSNIAKDTLDIRGVDSDRIFQLVKLPLPIAFGHLKLDIAGAAFAHSLQKVTWIESLCRKLQRHSQEHITWRSHVKQITISGYNRTLYKMLPMLQNLCDLMKLVSVAGEDFGLWPFCRSCGKEQEQETPEIYHQRRLCRHCRSTFDLHLDPTQCLECLKHARCSCASAYELDERPYDSNNFSYTMEYWLCKTCTKQIYKPCRECGSWFDRKCRIERHGGPCLCKDGGNLEIEDDDDDDELISNLAESDTDDTEEDGREEDPLEFIFQFIHLQESGRVDDDDEWEDLR